MKIEEVKDNSSVAETISEVKVKTKKEEVRVEMKKEETPKPQTFGALQYCNMYNQNLAITAFLSRRFRGKVKTVEEWAKIVNRAFNY